MDSSSGMQERYAVRGAGSHMTAKEYLSQVYQIERKIDSMVQEMQHLRTLVSNADQVLTDMPRSHNVKRFEDIVVDIVDFENEIAADKEKLAILKREIADAITRIDNRTYKLLLELRYLRYLNWKEISFVLEYDLHYVYKLHNKALQKLIPGNT